MKITKSDFDELISDINSAFYEQDHGMLQYAINKLKQLDINFDLEYTFNSITNPTSSTYMTVEPDTKLITISFSHKASDNVKKDIINNTNIIKMITHYKLHHPVKGKITFKDNMYHCTLEPTNYRYSGTTININWIPIQ